MVADDDEARVDLALAVMGVAASLSMVFALLEASIFLGGMSFPVSGVSSTGLEVVADAAAGVTVCVAWGVSSPGVVDLREAGPMYLFMYLF